MKTILYLVFLTSLNFSFSQVIFSDIINKKEPLDTLKYDEVYAYNIDFDSIRGIKTRWQIETSLDEIILRKPYSCSKRLLTNKQADYLNNLLTDTTTYGAEYADCFEPRLIFQYKLKGKDVFRVAICEDCGHLISTVNIYSPPLLLLFTLRLSNSQ